jgi:hypothetical protein
MIVMVKTKESPVRHKFFLVLGAFGGLIDSLVTIITLGNYSTMLEYLAVGYSIKTWREKDGK